MEKYYDEKCGFGEIIARGEDYIIVRWDADPWCPVKIFLPKK